MTSKQALAQARTLFGKQARVEDRGDPTSGPSREEARVALDKLRAQLSAEQQKEAENRKRIRELALRATRYRFQVGRISVIGGLGMFWISGQGVTWEEAVVKARAAK